MSTLGEDQWALGSVYRADGPCGCMAVIEPAEADLRGGAHDGAIVAIWLASLTACDEHGPTEEVAPRAIEVAYQAISRQAEAHAVLASMLESVGAL
jgi:hypothetical protein